jgi:hypothetical protein
MLFRALETTNANGTAWFFWFFRPMCQNGVFKRVWRLKNDVGKLFFRRKRFSFDSKWVTFRKNLESELPIDGLQDNLIMMVGARQQDTKTLTKWGSLFRHPQAPSRMRGKGKKASWKLFFLRFPFSKETIVREDGAGKTGHFKKQVRTIKEDAWAKPSTHIHGGAAPFNQISGPCETLGRRGKKKTQVWMVDGDG